MRLLAVGVDGWSFRVLDPWLRDGSLPHLARLMERGRHGVLKSTMPPLTPPAWYASLTGVNPGRQNIFGFFRPPRERYAKEPISAADLRAAAVWDHLGREGKRSVILFLPLSYPPRRLNGIMVSGFLTPDGAEDWACPAEVMAEIGRAVPGFRLNLDHRLIRLGRLDEFFREAVAVLEGQTAAAVHLIGATPWDFFFVHLHDVDSVTHLFWKHQDPRHPGYREGSPHRARLREYYQAVDESLGRLVRAAGEGTGVLVYSDHGFMPAYRWLAVNRWLADRGYLKLAGRRGLGLKSALARLGLGREKLSFWAGRLGLGGLARRLPAAVKGAVPQTRFSFNNLAPHVDWSLTRAFFLSASEGSLYANILGREPAGILGREEAARTIGEIREGLLDLKDPGTGRRVLAGAFRREEIFSGPYADSSPDLVLLPDEGYYFSENVLGPLFGPQGLADHQLSATHHPDGIIVAAGGPFAGPGEPLAAAVWDVAPTVLRVLDAGLPDGLDGRALEEALDPAFLRETPARHTAAAAPAGEGRGAISPEEMKKIIGNLEGLGYF